MPRHTEARPKPTDRARYPSINNPASYRADSSAGITGRCDGAGVRSVRTAVAAETSALAARDDVIEGEVVVGRAVLADKAITQEHVEPGEGGMRGRLDEGFQRHHARQLNLERGAAHRAVVMLDDVDAVEEHRLDRVLPRPERQRIITERPEVRIQHQYRPTALRDVCVQVTLLTPVLAAKQRKLTYYRQRDGIVKSVGRLIRRCAGFASGLHDRREDR